MKILTVIAAVVGLVLSGKAALWGACLAGHDSKAAYPFPDLNGFFLFWFGALMIPLVVAGIIGLIRRFTSKSHPPRLSIPVAILVFGPLLGLAVGYSVQSLGNRASDQRKEFDTIQREAYSRYSAQITTDPSVVLRERWFEKNSKDSLSAAMSARRMVFEHSFQANHLTVSYTGDQLREIYQQARDARLFVVGHPMCPPELIETMWSEVLSSRQAGAINRLIENPATPKHLLEEYQRQRIDSKRASGWIDEAIEKSLKDK